MCMPASCPVCAIYNISLEIVCSLHHYQIHTKGSHIQKKISYYFSALNSILAWNFRLRLTEIEVNKDGGYTKKVNYDTSSQNTCIQQPQIKEE